MRFLLFISFIALLACNNQSEQGQVYPDSELTILSKEIAKSPNNPQLFIKRAEYFLSENKIGNFCEKSEKKRKSFDKSFSKKMKF